MKLIIVMLSVVMSCVNAATLQEYLDYSKGKSLYTKEQYDEAEGVLKSALEHGEEPGKIYRALGDVAYQKNDYEQALKFYDQALLNQAENSDDVDISFNKGNAYLNQQQFDKAAEEYKNVLTKSPDDQSAKKNLEIALRLIQKQQEQQQQQNDPNKKKDQDKQDQKDQKQEEDKKNSDNDKNKDQSGENDREETPQNMEQEQAKQILKMIEESESDSRKKYRKKPESKGTIGNDW